MKHHPILFFGRKPCIMNFLFQVSRSDLGEMSLDRIQLGLLGMGRGDGRRDGRDIHDRHYGTWEKRKKNNKEENSELLIE